MSPSLDPPPPETTTESLVRRHLVLGWVGLFAFALLGVTLEGLHAFKVPFYLDVDSETRRFLWRLSHAHGTLLSVVHLGAAGTFSWASSRVKFGYTRLASHSLSAAWVLLPGGFFLGGVTSVDGDPGVGIVLVPVGATCLLTAVGLLALLVKRRAPEPPDVHGG